MSGSVGGGTVVGSGSDSIVLRMSGDSAFGQAPQFTVNVDGQQIGDLQTVTASHSSGDTQTFTFQGNYNAGPHTVTVTFANNFLLPSERASGDRNVYVNSLSYDGQVISDSTTPIYESPLFPPNSDHNIYGNAVFNVNDNTATNAGNATTTPGAVSVGSGNDTVVLKMAEDDYQGDAQFTVKVDGQQVGGTQTTTAHLNQGQAQEFDVHGNWGSGNHTVTVAFTNDHIGDFYPGTQLAIDTTDRNLYVMGVQLNGGPTASGTPWEIDGNWSQDFTVTSGSGGGGSSNGSSASTQVSTSSSGSSGSDNTQTSDNASISSSSLSSGSGSSGSMSFVAPTSDSSSGSSSSNSASSGASSDDASSGSGSSAGSSSGDTVASVTSSSGQGGNDWTAPAVSSGDDTSTSGTRAYGGHWSSSQGNWQGHWAAHSQS